MNEEPQSDLTFGLMIIVSQGVPGVPLATIPANAGIICVSEILDISFFEKT